jgi:hypothetical protein
MADSKYDKRLQEMLAEADATLVRSKKHIIYRLPNGEVVPVSQTPSDWRASRKRITALKHALAKEPGVSAETPSAAGAEEPLVRERMVIPNWPARGPAGEVEIKLEGSLPTPPAGAVFTPFGSVWDLQQHLAEMDEFWDLTPSGRVRVLLKSLPANVKPDVVPMIFCRATTKEAHLFQSSGKKSKQREQLLQLLMRRMRCTCGDGYYPALYLHDPEEGDLLVDVVSLSMLVDVVVDIQILDVGSGRDILISIPELWTSYVEGEPQEVDFILALSPQAARERGVNFMTDEGWSNPSATRHVVQAVRERHNPNFVPPPRPVIKQALTPFQQFQRKVLPVVREQLGTPHLEEIDWLVTRAITDPCEPLLSAETLDWVGRMLAFSFLHEGRNMGRRLDGTMAELWFSFPDEEHKQAFLEEVRADGYCDPDDESTGFHPPEDLEAVKELKGAVTVFDSDQRARITAVMESDERFFTAMMEVARLYESKHFLNRTKKS